jgi:hypothetical protein
VEHLKVGRTLTDNGLERRVELVEASQRQQGNGEQQGNQGAEVLSQPI